MQYKSSLEGIVGREYRKRVYQRSFDNVRRRIGIKGDALKLAIAIITTAFVISLSTALGLISYFTDLLGDTNVLRVIVILFGSDILFVITLYLAAPILAIFQMWSAAAEIDKEQKEKIKYYEYRYKNPDLLFEPIINNESAMLKIKNKENTDVRLRGKIININNQLSPNLPLEMLSEKGNQYGSLHIDPSLSETCRIADYTPSKTLQFRGRDHNDLYGESGINVFTQYS
jgi:hypothetical protein